MSFFTLKVLPARDGDCLLASFGKEHEQSHVLIDGGRHSTYARLKPLLERITDRNQRLELMVLTHNDADHIEGALRFLKDPMNRVIPKRTWFNGYEEMHIARVFGERQGDEFSGEIERLGWSWNDEFPDGVACIESAASPIVINGAKVRLLSPDRPHLEAMSMRWENWRDRNSSEILPFAIGTQLLSRKPMPQVLDVDTLAVPGKVDQEKPNGSSIAFILEFDGHRLLLGADAHPDVLVQAITPLAHAEGGRYHIDVCKLSHHGSAGNTTAELIRLLDCRRFVISSDGSRHGHPDPEAIARVLKYAPDGKKELIFNYRTERTTPWDNAKLKERHNYEATFGIAGEISIDISFKPSDLN